MGTVFEEYAGATQISLMSLDTIKHPNEYLSLFLKCSKFTAQVIAILIVIFPTIL